MMTGSRLHTYLDFTDNDYRFIFVEAFKLPFLWNLYFTR